MPCIVFINKIIVQPLNATMYSITFISFTQNNVKSILFDSH